VISLCVCFYIVCNPAFVEARLRTFRTAASGVDVDCKDARDSTEVEGSNWARTVIHSYTLLSIIHSFIHSYMTRLEWCCRSENSFRGTVQRH